MKTYATAKPAFSCGIYPCEDFINFPSFYGRKRIYYSLVIQIKKTSMHTSLGLVILSISHVKWYRSKGRLSPRHAARAGVVGTQ